MNGPRPYLDAGPCRPREVVALQQQRLAPRDLLGQVALRELLG